MFRFVRKKNGIFTDFQFLEFFQSLHDYKFQVKREKLKEDEIFFIQEQYIVITLPAKTGNKKQNPLILIPLNLLLYHVQKNMVFKKTKFQ